MLQFLKKPGRRPNSICDPTSSSSSGGCTNGCTPKDHLARLHNAEEACMTDTAPSNSPLSDKSRLFLCLPDILGDQNCLCYFLQFMEAADAVPLIKFWLAVENFRLSAQTIGTDEKEDTDQQQNAKSSCSTTDTAAEKPSRDNHRVEGTNCTANGRKEEEETCTNCDIEDRPLTDDEKSEIIQDKRAAKQKQQKGGEISPKPHQLRTKRNSQFQTTVATDAIKIFEKFLCSSSDSWIADIPATIHSRISLSMCNCDSDTLVSPLCFVEAQQFVLERMEKDFLRPFLDSEFYCKYCVEILTADDLRLADILYSESALFYFMEFLEQQQHRDYLDFWMSATNFRRHSTVEMVECPVVERRTDAMVLYDKYFSLQATNSLQFSDSVRSQVEERICSSEENILMTCFDFAIQIVERLFSDSYLEKFFASELFYKYVTELVNRSQQPAVAVRHPRVLRTQSLTKGAQSNRHKRMNSDGTGEVLRRTNSVISISSQNTLLAMETPPMSSKMAKLSSQDMKIDSRMFFNADLLWKRCQKKEQPPLSFGRVNALGRFERDFDWDEGVEERNQSAGSRLKKAVKKLVHLPEDKVQEELAWQVAEMIIKDVTDVTMNGGGGGGGGVESELGRRRSSAAESVLEEE